MDVENQRLVFVHAAKVECDQQRLNNYRYASLLENLQGVISICKKHPVKRHLLIKHECINQQASF
jgi:hypothetical protein